MSTESLITRVEKELKSFNPHGLRRYIVNMQRLGPIANKNTSIPDPVTEKFEELTMMEIKLGSGERLDQDEMDSLVSIIKKCIISSDRSIM